MHDALWSFCEWLETVSWTHAIDNSKWMSGVMYVSHYFSFFVMTGTMTVMALRLLGVGGARGSAIQVARQLFPWTWAAFSVAMFSGFVMFAADATSFFPSAFFWVKVVVALLGSVFAWIAYRSTRKSDPAAAAPAAAKVTAFISLLLWVGAILAAVEIPNN